VASLAGARGGVPGQSPLAGARSGGPGLSSSSNDHLPTIEMAIYICVPELVLVQGGTKLHIVLTRNTSEKHLQRFYIFGRVSTQLVRREE
jgi:hypothetical protein